MKETLRKTSTGIEHGLITMLINQVPKADAFKKLDPKRKEELEKRIKKNSEMVQVRYVNYKNQESGHRCVDYYAGPGEPIYVFKFLHDFTYTIPRGLAEQVNDPKSKMPVRADSLDESGKPRAKDGPSRRIDEFVGISL